jgi:hypothetical protein
LGGEHGRHPSDRHRSSVGDWWRIPLQPSRPPLLTLTLGAGNIITAGLKGNRYGVITHGAITDGTGKFRGATDTYDCSSFPLNENPAAPVQITLHIR